MFIDMGFLCTYSTSSKSKWENSASGSPLDGSLDTHRFSFHTEKEKNPFINIDTPGCAPVSKLRLNFRARYKKNSLPIRILLTREEGDELVYDINEDCEANYWECTVDDVIKSIKVTSLGYKSLDFSSLNIWVKAEAFLSYIKSFDLDRVVYTHSGFYGLGGKLAVLATSLGFLGRSAGIKNVFCDSGLSGIVDFPIPYSGSENKVLTEFIRSYASEPVASYIFNGKHESEKNVSRYVPLPLREQEFQKFVFITRDAIADFSFSEESDAKLMQRLYGRIVPNKAVSKVLKGLNEDYRGDVAGKSIGIHFRHGNGELYVSRKEKVNVWGVKPPLFNDFFEHVDAILNNDVGVDSLFLASDCPAVEGIFKQRYAGRLNVQLISKNIQKVGAGCNHTNKVFFDQLNRVDVDPIADDQIAFGEMLFLSRCDYLVGGESYFFNAVIGFSSVDERSIFKISNKDRYAKLNPCFVPLLESEHVDFRDIIRASVDYLDGVFVAKKADGFHVNYFDVNLLKVESFDDFQQSDSVKLTQLLKYYRGY